MQSSHPEFNRLSLRIRGKGVHWSIGALTGFYIFPGAAVALIVSLLAHSSLPFALYLLGFPTWVFGICDRWMLVPVSRTIFGPIAVLYAVAGILALIGTLIPHAAGAIGWLVMHALGLLVTIGPLAFIGWLAYKLLGQRKRSLAAMDHARMVEAMAPQQRAADATPDPNDSAAWGIGPG